MLDQVVDQDHQKLLLHEGVIHQVGETVHEVDIHLVLHTHQVDHRDHHIVGHRLHMEQVLDLQVLVLLHDQVLHTHQRHGLVVLLHTVDLKHHTVQVDQVLHRADIHQHQDLQDTVLEVLHIHQLLREVDTHQVDHLHTEVDETQADEAGILLEAHHMADHVEVTLQVDEVGIVLAEGIHQEAEEASVVDVVAHEVEAEVSTLM